MNIIKPSESPKFPKVKSLAKNILTFPEILPLITTGFVKIIVTGNPVEGPDIPLVFISDLLLLSTKMTIPPAFRAFNANQSL